MAKKQSLSFEQSVLVITYGHGETLRLDTADLPENVWLDCAAARHGLMQKMGDAKSGGTSREKAEEVRAIWQNLIGGDWNRRGESGGLDAIIEEVFGILDPARIGEWMAKWAKCSEEQKAEIAAKPAVKAAINKVKADRRMAKADTEDADPFDL